MTSSPPRILISSIALWCGVVTAPLLAAAEPAGDSLKSEPTAGATAPAAAATKATPAESPPKVAPIKEAAAAAFTAPRETAIAAVLERLGVAGQVEVVKGNDESFLTLVTSPHRSETPVGAVLLIPAPPGAVSDTLLLALVEAPTASGWLTMAMQPPPTKLATSDDTSDEFCARLAASLKFLQTRQVMPVVLAGIGRSVDHSLACYAGKLPAEIAGVVGIGRWHSSLKALELPVLDVPPAADREAQQTARQRTVTAEGRARSDYRQISIDAVDDRFEGAEAEVAKRLRGWLTQLPLKPKA